MVVSHDENVSLWVKQSEADGLVKDGIWCRAAQYLVAAGQELLQMQRLIQCFPTRSALLLQLAPPSHR